MMKNSSTKVRNFLLVVLSFAFIFTVNSYSQYENPDVDQDPNVDQVPLLLRQNYQQQIPTDAPPVTINGFDNFNMGTDFAEPHIYQNPLSPEQFFNAYNINSAHRTLDGHEWIFSAPSFGGSVAGDPVTAYDGLGNLFYMNMTSPITSAKVIKSTDNGQTWGPAVIAVSGADKCWIAADQTSGPYANYIYATMTATGFSGQNFARSTDGGATFTQTFTAVNSPLPGAMVCVGPNDTVDGGAVYFVTNFGNSFGASYGFYRSTDGGATFQLMSTQNFANYVGTNVNGRNSVQNFRTRPYPFIAADNSNGTYRGRLYLVYASNNPVGNGNKPDIFCRYSDDQGVTWSGPVTVNDDPSSQNNHQWHPSIWCDVQTGRLYAKWMDTRDTPTSDSAFIYASYSDDGGQTFVTNQKISNQKMRINCTSCNGGTPAYLGDYDAITSYGDVSMAVWSDFRNNNFGSYTGYFPDFAMLVSPNMVSLQQSGGTDFVTVDVPATTLYSSDAIFSATVSPSPATGSITVDFPTGNTLSTFPGDVQMRIQTSGNVTLGSYTITVEGKGPNAIPVHRRTVTLDVVVPVELASFSATTEKNDVVLHWSTASETNNQGFEVQRRSQAEYEKVGFVVGKGTTTELQNYVYKDEDISSGSYSYRLKQVDFDGTIEYSNEVEVDITQPKDYFLSQNYPNPFNPSTTIKYAVVEDGLVSLKVYDVLGNEVSTIIDNYQPAGEYNAVFDASSISSGVYYYQIKAGDFTSTKKLILMK
jgi:hypothetical protein